MAVLLIVPPLQPRGASVSSGRDTCWYAEAIETCSFAEVGNTGGWQTEYGISILSVASIV